MSMSFQHLCFSAGPLPHTLTAQGSTGCQTRWGRAAGEPQGQDSSSKGIHAGGVELGTAASQPDHGRMGTQHHPGNPSCQNSSSPPQRSALSFLMCKPGWLKCEEPEEFFFSKLGVYTEISATGRVCLVPLSPCNSHPGCHPCTCISPTAGSRERLGGTVEL